MGPNREASERQSSSNLIRQTDDILVRFQAEAPDLEDENRQLSVIDTVSTGREASDMLADPQTQVTDVEERQWFEELAQDGKTAEYQLLRWLKTQLGGVCLRVLVETEGIRKPWCEDVAMPQLLRSGEGKLHTVVTGFDFASSDEPIREITQNVTDLLKMSVVDPDLADEQEALVAHF